MTQAEQEFFESLNNLRLVEHLLIWQERCDEIRAERNSINPYEEDKKWQDTNNRLYDACELVLDLKYMIIKRMGGCTGTGK